MILPIVQYGNPILREKCAEVKEITPELEKLVSDMIETMEDAHGVGLAAPQIGEGIQLAIVDVSHDPECFTFLKVNGEEVLLEKVMPLVFINPVLELGSERETDLEGCLSIQEIQGKVSRPATVRATLPQLDGSVLEVEADGLIARAIQHETDHLNGVLFVDRMSPASKLNIKKKLKALLPRRR